MKVEYVGEEGEEEEEEGQGVSEGPAEEPHKSGSLPVFVLNNHKS